MQAPQQRPGPLVPMGKYTIIVCMLRQKDPEQVKLIDTLVGFIVRDGLDFENMLKQRHAGDPKFAFLFNGENADYYKWRLYQAGVLEISNNRTVTAPVPQPVYYQQQPAQSMPPSMQIPITMQPMPMLTAPTQGVPPQISSQLFSVTGSKVHEGLIF